MSSSVQLDTSNVVVSGCMAMGKAQGTIRRCLIARDRPVFTDLLGTMEALFGDGVRLCPSTLYYLGSEGERISFSTDSELAIAFYMTEKELKVFMEELPRSESPLQIENPSTDSSAIMTSVESSPSQPSTPASLTTTPSQPGQARGDGSGWCGANSGNANSINGRKQLNTSVSTTPNIYRSKIVPKLAKHWAMQKQHNIQINKSPKSTAADNSACLGPIIGTALPKSSCALHASKSVTFIKDELSTMTGNGVGSNVDNNNCDHNNYTTTNSGCCVVRNRRKRTTAIGVGDCHDSVDTAKHRPPWNYSSINQEDSTNNNNLGTTSKPSNVDSSVNMMRSEFTECIHCGNEIVLDFDQCECEGEGVVGTDDNNMMKYNGKREDILFGCCCGGGVVKLRRRKILCHDDDDDDDEGHVEIETTKTMGKPTAFRRFCFLILLSCVEALTTVYL